VTESDSQYELRVSDSECDSEWDWESELKHSERTWQ
jgi:hypothetical protein